MTFAGTSDETDERFDSLERRNKRKHLLHFPLRPYTALDNPSKTRPWSIVEHRSCSEGRTLLFHSSYATREEATKNLKNAISDMYSFTSSFDARQIKSTIRHGLRCDYFYFFDPFDIFSFSFTIEYGFTTDDVLRAAIRHYHLDNIEHQPIKPILSHNDKPTPQKPWKVVEYRLTRLGLYTYFYGSYATKKQALKARHTAFDDLDRFVENHGGLWTETFKALDNRHYRSFSFNNDKIIIAFSLCVEKHEFPR